MSYFSKEIYVENPLSFWAHFSGEEQFFFFNQLTNEYILGARRQRAVSVEEAWEQYIAVFSTQYFFEQLQGDLWSNFGNEHVVFDYYLVKSGCDIRLFYVGDEPQIIDRPTKEIVHHWKYTGEDDYENWQIMFNGIQEEIAKGHIEKAVLSREVKLECEEEVNTESIIDSLVKRNKNSFIFGYENDGKTFLGATPEILVQKKGQTILSYALAGTMPRYGDDDQLQKKQLLNDEKNLHEHGLVVEAIIDAMESYGETVNIGDTHVLTLTNLHHLKTSISIEDEHSSLWEWVNRLHPTPALGGKPADQAIKLIRKYENHERGLYAAPLGITKQNGEGIVVVGIRSALIEGKMIYAYAGCGIVQQSDCLAEYEETKNKLKTIVESLG